MRGRRGREAKEKTAIQPGHIRHPPGGAGKTNAVDGTDGDNGEDRVLSGPDLHLGLYDDGKSLNIDDLEMCLVSVVSLARRVCVAQERGLAKLSSFHDASRGPGHFLFRSEFPTI